MQKHFINGLLFGWIAVLTLILISSLILALLLRVSTLDSPAVSWVALGIGILSLFIGGLIAGLKAKSKGWIIGGLTGAGFTLFTFLVQYLGYQQGFSMDQTLQHLGYILSAIFGGMIGVNLIGSSRK